jgi:translation initiation factor IF-2
VERKSNKIPIDLPITVRTLSNAIGMQAVPLLMSLSKYGIPNATINSTIDQTVAETIALDKGIELDIKKAPDTEARTLAEIEKPSDPANLILRAPVVAVMGHVDHGKTSLLDKIRQSDAKISKSNIVSTEAGGITQVIRAWRVEHGGKPVTFLDTPGHEAFTKMRARGAQVTDVAVIVVAADDGVMPQTEEAINHAKAAGVSIVVAINKVDLPNANLKKTEQQLYSLNLLPDTMGGDTPFVYTSATTGKGIDELLDMLSLVAELKELKADPTRSARGTCLEAALSEGEGVRATLIVRDGTLRRGDVILCGSTYGRVRAMYDDLGRPLQEAGPSVPVLITGLDEVPDADDPFVVVPDLAEAREISEGRKGKRQAGLTGGARQTFTLETLSQAKVAEVKVILKADFKGSVEAIKKELEKLTHAEVRVHLLHAGIGGITESDVVLALTSPEDTIIVGFNVVPDDRARALAEERGVEIREYQIIYNLTDDIRSAMEGKLKPHEQVIHLGRAIVRQTFKISRVGTVAGCHVTQGTIERSAKVRLIRQGEIIFPPPERTASLESLKRIKDDVREVREGFECGMKIAGYDDIKVDDVIECFRVEQVQRTL